MSTVFSHFILSVPKDYCDIFNATCPGNNQIIVMETALYGRMRTGYCIEEDHGYIGCSANILPVLDNKCSGRKTCEMSIPIRKFKFQNKKCPSEVISYLQASYRCQTGKTLRFNLKNDINNYIY